MIFSLIVDQDWTYYDLKENTPLMFLGKQYDKDKMRTVYIFRELGKPLENEPKTVIEIV